MVRTDSKLSKLPYSPGLLVVQTDSKLLKLIEFMWNCQSPGLLVVRTDSKLSKRISFIWNYLIMQMYVWFEPFETHRPHLKLLYSAGLISVRTDLKLSKLPYSPGLLVVWTETIKTHQIHLKLLYCAGLLVQTDSKLLKHQIQLKLPTVLRGKIHRCGNKWT